MTDPIPDDLRAKALKIAKEAIYNGGVAWAADDIAQALMQERERCWKIADDEDDRSPCNPAAAVARRIISPDKTESQA